jgi:hypothetical protein
MLLAAYAALVWFYLSAISRGIDVLTSNHAESVRALLAIKEQHSNLRVDAREVS